MLVHFLPKVFVVLVRKDDLNPVSGCVGKRNVTPSLSIGHARQTDVTAFVLQAYLGADDRQPLPIHQGDLQPGLLAILTLELRTALPARTIGLGRD